MSDLLEELKKKSADAVSKVYYKKLMEESLLSNLTPSTAQTIPQKIVSKIKNIQYRITSIFRCDCDE